MRFFAGVCALLAVLSAAATAAALGLALTPQEDGSTGGVWSFVLIAGAAAVVFGAVAVTLLRRSD